MVTIAQDILFTDRPERMVPEVVGLIQKCIMNPGSQVNPLVGIDIRLVPEQARSPYCSEKVTISENFCFYRLSHHVRSICA